MMNDCCCCDDELFALLNLNVENILSTVAFGDISDVDRERMFHYVSSVEQVSSALLLDIVDVIVPSAGFAKFSFSP